MTYTPPELLHFAATHDYSKVNETMRVIMDAAAEIERLHAALVAITNVPAGTVLTAHQMRMIAKNAIAP